MPEYPQTFPSQLYIRLTNETIVFARFSVVPAFFETACWKIRPEITLAANLREASAALPLLHAPVEQIRVLVESPVCIVPLTDFQEEDCDTIHRYCFASEEPCQVFYDTVPGCGIALLFALGKQAKRELEEVYPEAVYLSSATPLMRHFVRKSKGMRRIFASAEGEKMFLAALDGNKLLSACFYDIHSPSDAVYFITYTAQTFGFDIDEIPVFVSGIPYKRNKICEELRPFVRNTVNVKPAAEFNRNFATADENVPYDLLTFLIN